MNDEDKTQRAINRGQKARELMDNELLTEAFVTLERDYVAAWRTTRALDRDAREKLWHAVNIVGKVRDHLHKLLADGKLAQADLRMRMTKPR